MRRILFIGAVSAFLVGCPPMDPVLKSRDIQVIEAGHVIDNEAERLFSNDEEVDRFSLLISDVLRKQGFYLAYSSTSWGLLPLTGHTQNMSYKTKSNEYISCSVTVSKTEFKARFVEYEEKLKSNNYVTSTEDKAQIIRAAKALTDLAKEIFNERAIHVSVVQY